MGVNCGSISRGEAEILEFVEKGLFYDGRARRALLLMHQHDDPAVAHFKKAVVAWTTDGSNLGEIAVFFLPLFYGSSGYLVRQIWSHVELPTGE